MLLKRAMAAATLGSMLALTVYAGQQAKAASVHVAFSANFLDDLFEYKADIDANQLFPTEEVKDDIIDKLQAHDYNITYIEREFIGINVSASDVRIHITPSKMEGDEDDDSNNNSNTRLAVDVQGKNIEVESKYFDKKYDKLDIDTIYGVYNAGTDKVTIHVPYSTAFALMFR